MLQVIPADVLTTNVQTGVLVGTDTDGALLKYAIASQGTNGTVAITNAATGAYTYTPSAGNFVPDSFTFTVDDGTGPSVAGTIQVVQNGFAPVISSNGGGATTAVTVSENQAAVTTMTATDADGAQSLTYSISGGADAAKFNIDSSSGVLSFAAAPNFEAPTDAGADNVYAVQVQVSDGNGAGALTDVQAIAVTVADVNEAPVISSNGGGGGGGSGGGGCSLSADPRRAGFDPMLPLLALTSLLHVRHLRNVYRKRKRPFLLVQPTLRRALTCRRWAAELRRGRGWLRHLRGVTD